MTNQKKNPNDCCPICRKQYETRFMLKDGRTRYQHDGGRKNHYTVETPVGNETKPHLLTPVLTNCVVSDLLQGKIQGWKNPSSVFEGFYQQYQKIAGQEIIKRVWDYGREQPGHRWKNLILAASPTIEPARYALTPTMAAGLIIATAAREVGRLRERAWIRMELALPLNQEELNLLQEEAALQEGLDDLDAAAFVCTMRVNAAAALGLNPQTPFQDL